MSQYSFDMDYFLTPYFVEGQFFEPGILTVTRQWHLIYKQKFREFLEAYKKPEPTDPIDEGTRTIITV